MAFALQAVMFVGNACLRGTGHTRLAMYIIGPVILAVRVPTALLLGVALGVGLTGAWLGTAADLSMRGIISFLRFRSGRWRMVPV
jgi:Na+-driven multidrug efflux pump